MRSTHFVFALACLMLAVGDGWAQADFPNKPIRVVVTVAAGAASDTIARRLGEQAGKALGQQVIVENKPGAQSMIAARYVAKAPHDGYTLLVGSNTTHAANPYLVKDLGYDPVKDFTPITLWTVNPLLLVVNSELPVRTVQEFVKYAKDRPGKLNYGVGNTGGLVAVQLLKSQTGIEATPVNYQGTAPAMTDLAAGRLDFMVTDPSVVRSFVQQGKVRVLGITSKQKLASFPDVATLSESGLPGYDYASWVGLFAPSGTPPEVVRRIQAAYAKALADPANQKFLSDLGMIAESSTPDQLEKFVQKQLEFWGRLTKEAGLTPQ
ncbi:MAG: tripartite tricarboxylate transporter substrate binding protein [Burkholderiales bacterium]|nr:tripartite tricarboxylate transporter substrate binding protein [Burkholderiales bacterium]